ncbi:MAG: carboxypeptidase-like regulatory domain-containing protein [Muribaculaceae bacterium]|nr:carboxypeptidase-like regulatory domain-containing protein [Muribaculaceae bacterium]
MKKSLLSLILLWCMVAVCSCSSDIELDSGGIAGSVSDATTGEPVSTVNVTLNPGGKSTVTGSDGTFSFNNLEAGEYTLDISKEGYKANSATVTVKNGEPVPAHLLIERIPAIVTADRDTLDFGDNQSLNTMSFNIVNSSYEDLEWEIEERCDWITEIKPAKGTLKYGKTEGIVVIIDRTKLSKGVNKAVIVIRSSNGSSQMNVLATGAQAIVTADRDTLDFGDNQSLNTMSFNIVNSTYEDLEWEIEERCDWITEIKPAKGTLKHGKTEGVAVIIDRARLSKGVNKAMIIINSSYGSLEMNVLATGTEIVLPKLNVLAATTISISSAQLNGEIIDDGIPAYSERGFVYSLNSMPTLENTISKLTCTSNSNKTYSYLLNELSPNTTYFVRAYAKSSKGVVYSVNEIKFKTLVATPKVTTLEIANIDLSNGTATFRGEITYAGIPSYTERGFVYSTLPEPTIYDNKVIAGGAGTVGGFSKYVTNHTKSTY